MSLGCRLHQIPLHRTTGQTQHITEQLRLSQHRGRLQTSSRRRRRQFWPWEFWVSPNFSGVLGKRDPKKICQDLWVGCLSLWITSCVPSGFSIDFFWSKSARISSQQASFPMKYGPFRGDKTPSSTLRITAGSQLQFFFRSFFFEKTFYQVGRTKKHKKMEVFLDKSQNRTIAMLKQTHHIFQDIEHKLIKHLLNKIFPQSSALMSHNEV